MPDLIIKQFSLNSKLSVTYKTHTFRQLRRAWHLILYPISLVGLIVPKKRSTASQLVGLRIIIRKAKKRSRQSQSKKNYLLIFINFRRLTEQLNSIVQWSNLERFVFVLHQPPKSKLTNPIEKKWHFGRRNSKNLILLNL